MTEWANIRITKELRKLLKKKGDKDDTYTVLINRLLIESNDDSRVENVILKLINLTRKHHAQFGEYCSTDCPYPAVIKEAEAVVHGA